jgi:hypothetical protein
MRTALALALAAGACACHRPQPSPEYQQARDKHFALIASYPLDAAGRPEMDEVLGLLERVPKSSLDAEAAAALRDQILGERKAVAEERARRAKLVEAAGTPTAWAGTSGSTGGSGAPAQAAGGGAAAPAGIAAGEGGAAAAAAAPQLEAGMPLADFQKVRGDCAERRAPARILQPDGKSAVGEAWAIRDTEECKKAHPGEAGKLMVFVEGKLAAAPEAGQARATQATQKIEGVAGKDGAPALPPGLKLPPGATVKWNEQPAAAGKPGAPPPAPTPPAAAK